MQSNLLSTTKAEIESLETLVRLARSGGGGGITSGAQIIAFLVGTATASSSASIPAGSLVLRRDVIIQIAYSPGISIQVGQTGNVAALQASTDNVPGVVDTYSADDEVTAWGASPLPVLVTISGAPSQGQALIVVEYVAPPILT